MAPALTQTAEPPIVVDIPYHSPTYSLTDANSYCDLKKLNKRKKSLVPKEDFEPSCNYLANRDSILSGLAPPASCWAEGSPYISTSPCRSNMDNQSTGTFTDKESSLHCPVPVSNSNSTSVTMGLELKADSLKFSPNLISSGSEIVTPSLDGTSVPMHNHNDLMSLVGRDFDNVNEIIDTLQKLASNPEFLDAASRDLEPENQTGSNNTQEKQSLSLLSRLGVRQKSLEGRRLFLLRRLRRVASQGLFATVSSQLSEVIHHVRGIANKDQSDALSKETSPPLMIDMFKEESMKSMSTSDLISLVRKFETSSNLQKLQTSNKFQECLRSLSSELCEELDAVSSEMRTATLTHSAYDSDATESSSGGESCDENEVDQTPTDPVLPYKPLCERALYKYLRRRGRIASKWMWLQAQIADLDYRILQQQKLLGHIRKRKGAVKLSNEIPTTRPVSNLNPAELNLQDSALTCVSLASRQVYNGFYPSSCSSAESLDSSAPTFGDVSEACSGCARTAGIGRLKRRRYVKPNVFFRRRGSTRHSLYGSRLTRSKCRCVPPATCMHCIRMRPLGKIAAVRGPQFLSGGRVRAFELLHQPLSEKLDVVDQGYHTILSSPKDLLQSEFINLHLKSSLLESHSTHVPDETVQASEVNAPVSSASAPSTEVSSAEPSLSSLYGLKQGKPEREYRRSYRRKLSRDRSKERSLLDHSSYVPLKRSEDAIDETDDEVVSVCQGATSDGNGFSSPCPSPALVETRRERGAKGTQTGSEATGRRRHTAATRQKQNSTSNSYDINNIVIPSVMAASSRVELLQYKEIPTPKWKMSELSPLPRSSEELPADVEEDLSDSLLEARHARSQEAERKKFLSYQIGLGSSRPVRMRRADSSGTNTPDNPLSPRLLEPIEGSPVGSPMEPNLLEVAEDSNSAIVPPSSSCDGGCSSSTVLTLSLSSLTGKNKDSSVDLGSSAFNAAKSSEPSPLIEGGQDSNADSASYLPNSVSGVHKTKPAEVNQRDRLSPFPFREFPLDENEYLDLVCEGAETKRWPAACSEEAPPKDSVPPLDSKSGFTTDSLSTLSDITRADMEGGHSTPLSELTDSATEEEAGYAVDEKEHPDWTISAVSDDVGGLVLTVQKN